MLLLFITVDVTVITGPDDWAGSTTVAEVFSPVVALVFMVVLVADMFPHPVSDAMEAAATIPDHSNRRFNQILPVFRPYDNPLQANPRSTALVGL